MKTAFAVKLVFEKLIWKNNKPGFIFENIQTQNLKNKGWTELALGLEYQNEPEGSISKDDSNAVCLTDIHQLLKQMIILSHMSKEHERYTATLFIW